MDLRRIGVAAFQGLSAIAALGAALSILALLGGAVYGLHQAGQGCYVRGGLIDPECPDRLGMRLAIASGVAILGAFGSALFIAVLVAAGGPRRRGARWSARHRPALIQARSWVADGLIPVPAFDGWARRFRRQEAGEGEGQILRASGGCLVAVGTVAAIGAIALGVVLDGTWTDKEALRNVIATWAWILGLTATAMLVTGLPLYVWGRRATRKEAAAIDAAMDDLARLANATTLEREPRAASRRRSKKGSRSPP